VSLVDALRERGHEPAWIDMGGGVPMSYLEDPEPPSSASHVLADSPNRVGAIPRPGSGASRRPIPMGAVPQRELRQVLERGVPGEDIVVTAAIKPEPLLRLAVDSGATASCSPCAPRTRAARPPAGPPHGSAPAHWPPAVPGPVPGEP
jgi:hypothetical protein